MKSAILTLQLPVPGRIIPLASATQPGLIKNFCTQIFDEYVGREQTAVDEIEAAVYRAELERLRRVFSLISPDFSTESEVSDD